jgi:hypothetical protein
MQHWQGPFAGLGGLLEVWAGSAVVAVVVLLVSMWLVVRALHRRSPRTPEAP